MWSLEKIGWQYAETVLRPVVRYLSTTPALGSGDPAAFSEAFRTGVAATHPSWAHLFSPDDEKAAAGSVKVDPQPRVVAFPSRMVEAVNEWEHVRQQGKALASMVSAATVGLGCGCCRDSDD